MGSWGYEFYLLVLKVSLTSDFYVERLGLLKEKKP